MGNNPSLGQPESRLTRGVGGSLRGPAGGGRGPRGTADRAAVLFRSLDASVASSMVGNSAGVAHARKEDEDGLVDEEAVEVSEDTGPLNIEEGKNGTEVMEEGLHDGNGERPFSVASHLNQQQHDSAAAATSAIADRINKEISSRTTMTTRREPTGPNSSVVIATSPNLDPEYAGQLMYRGLQAAAKEREAAQHQSEGDGSKQQQQPPIRPPRLRPKESSKPTVPTVFKLFWPQQQQRPQPAEVSVGGSFNEWKLVPMVATRGNSHFCVIIDLEEGSHQYKFKVDNQWIHNPREKTTPDGMGGFNNVITVEKSDFEVFEALEHDSKDVASRKRQRYASLGGAAAKYVAAQSTHRHCETSSFDGQDAGIIYGQDIPTAEDYEELHFSSVAANFGGGGGMYGSCGGGAAAAGLSRTGGPPVLPPHLLQVILNKDTPLSCEPTLLPKPNHVLLNHMYALSIKDRVMVMSATQRFRKKYVTTILYRPID